MVGPVQTEGVLAVPGVDLQMSPDDPNPHSRFLVTASTSKGNSGGPTFEQSSCRLLGLTQENMVTHVGFEVDQGEGKPKLSGTYGAPVNHLTTISTPQQLWALLAKAKLTPVGQSAP